MLSEIPRTNSMTNCRIGWVTTTTPMRFPSTRSTRCSRLVGGAEAVLHVVSNRRGKQIRKIYGGLRDRSDKAIFPGYPMGGEAEPGGWGPWITGLEPGKASMYAFSTQFFKNMVYSNPEWNFRTFDPVRDTQTADEKFARVLNSNDPDLKRFRDRGGKLILYHGWSDAAIPAYNIIDYYRSVEQKMG